MEPGNRETGWKALELSMLLSQMRELISRINRRMDEEEGKLPPKSSRGSIGQ